MISSHADLRSKRRTLARKALEALDRARRCVAGSQARTIHAEFAKWYLSQACAVTQLLAQTRSWEQARAERERLDSANALIAHSTWSGVAP